MKRAARRTLLVWGAALLVAVAGACSGGGSEPPSAALDCPVVAPADAGAVDAPAFSDVPEPPKQRKTAWLFDDEAAPRHLRLTLAPEDWVWLQDNATLEQYVPASVELVGGERFDGAAVRFKGAYGSLFACFTPEGERTCPKLSLKVSFNRTDKKGRFYGVRKLILNSCNRDPTCLHERMAYTLFRAAGVQASRTVHVAVSVNGEPERFYVLVEEVDHEFLEDHFADPDGNLFKEIWPQYDEPDAYLGALRTNEEAADVARIAAFATFLREQDVTADPALLDPWVSRPTMARYLAVDQLTNNWDGIWKFYCSGIYCGNHNFFLYEDPTTGRFTVIPWDLDHTFARPNRDLARSWWDDGPEVCVPERVNDFASIIAPQCDPLLRGLMRGDWARYRATLRELVLGPDAPLSRERVLALLDRYRAQLWPLVETDPDGPGLAAWRRAVAELRQAIQAQWDAAHLFLEESDEPPQGR